MAYSYHIFDRFDIDVVTKSRYRVEFPCSLGPGRFDRGVRMVKTRLQWHTVITSLIGLILMW
jgi:hypothetical protein